jgi:hypothetical protein
MANDIRIAGRKASIPHGFAFCITGLLVLLAACGQKTPTQIAVGKLLPGWNVQILEVSEPEQVMIISDQSAVGLGEMALPQKPIEKNQKWLALRIRITPSAQPKAENPADVPEGVSGDLSEGIPGGEPGVVLGEGQPRLGPVGSLTFAEIRLTGSSGDSYAVEALSTGKMWKGKLASGELREFLRPAFSQYRFDDASGGLAIVLDYGQLLFYKAEGQELGLLFPIPKGARNLLLQL